MNMVWEYGDCVIVGMVVSVMVIVIRECRGCLLISM